MSARTFNEWSSAGFQILKGSKATRVNGVPMFTEQQVRPSSERSSGREFIGCTPSFDAGWEIEEEFEGDAQP